MIVFTRREIGNVLTGIEISMAFNKIVLSFKTWSVVITVQNKLASDSEVEDGVKTSKLYKISVNICNKIKVSNLTDARKELFNKPVIQFIVTTKKVYKQYTCCNIQSNYAQWLQFSLGLLCYFSLYSSISMDKSHNQRKNNKNVWKIGRKQ